METIGVKELRDNLSQIIKKVEKGKIIQVSRHGKPVIELRPGNLPPVHDLVVHLNRQGLSGGGSGIIGNVKSVGNRNAGTQVSDYVIEDRR